MAKTLETFLLDNLEGYLFQDIETLKLAAPRPGIPYGAAGYPLLMTVFAGIELLGNLVSANVFDKNKGDERFKEFWQNYLYPKDPLRRNAGPVLYRLARHGLVHAFVVKGDLTVYKGVPYMHLTKSANGAVSVDAAELAADLQRVYATEIKSKAIPGSALFDSMSRRLAEMEAEYVAQAAKDMSTLTLPLPPTLPVVAVTASSPPVSGATFTPTYKSNP